MSKNQNESEIGLKEDRVQFMFKIEQEFKHLYEIPAGYDRISAKFELLKQDLQSTLENRSARSSLTSKKTTEQKYQLLTEKFRTPLEKRTFSFLTTTKPSTSNDQLRQELFANEQSEPETRTSPSSKSKKRTAKIAEISIISDENGKHGDIADKDVERDENRNSDSAEQAKTVTKKKKTTKSKTGNLKKKKKPTNSPVSNDVIDLTDEMDEAAAAPKLDSKKSKNPSKKLKVDKPSKNENEMDTTFKDDKQPEHVDVEVQEINTKKKKKLTKQRTIHSNDNQENLDPSNEQKSSSPPPTKNRLILAPKTPMTNRLSRLLSLKSTIKKTIKAKPLTRRAAAAARAAASTTSASASTTSITTVSSTSSSSSNTQTKAMPIPKPSIIPIESKLSSNHPDAGKVRKIVDRFETTAKTIATPHTIKKPLHLAFIQSTISKSNKIRSSIHKRKSNLSQLKLSTKRKSEKKVQAFLKDVKQQNHQEQADKIVVTDELNNTISINTNTPQDTKIIKNILNSTSPKCVISKIPKGLMPHSTSSSISASHANRIISENEKRLSKDLLENNQSIMQQYRPVHLKTVSSSAIKATPSKPSYFQSLTNLANQNLYSNKFTPSKVTRTEAEEKRKAELLLKELKEKEHLAELEKQKQEKANEAKKKRDEKLKKVNDVKAKQVKEAEDKANEIRRKAQEESDKKKLLNSTQSTNNSANSTYSTGAPKPANPVLASAQKKQNVLNPVSLNKCPQIVINKDNCSEYISSFKKSIQMSQQFQQNAIEQSQAIARLQKQHNVLLSKDNKSNNLETTYVLNTPHASATASKKNPLMNTSNYDCTPLQVPKLKDADNYDVSDIRSDDDTDDEEEPSKPIPAWAKEPLLVQKAQDQCLKAVNFTKMFKSSCSSEINLEHIFRHKRKKFVERSSSANWETPPVWSTNGLCGEESFMQVRKNC